MKKQPNSQMCFVCGLENPIGLKMAFYEDDLGRVIARFTPDSEHEGYPGVVHGGIVTALLDEALSRSAIARGRWVVTVRLNVRFRRPTPTAAPLTVVGEIVECKKRTVEARASIILANGQISAQATGTFVDMPSEQAEQMEEALGRWEIAPDGEPPDFEAWGVSVK